MITLDFSISSEWNQRPASITQHADETELRYRVLLGSIVFRAGGCDFSAPWGWIPILDFACCMNALTSQLASGATEREFEFTESDSKLCFASDGRNIRITSNYSDGEANESLVDLISAVRHFTNDVKRHVETQFPSLVKNPAYEQLWRSIS